MKEKILYFSLFILAIIAGLIACSKTDEVSVTNNNGGNPSVKTYAPEGVTTTSANLSGNVVLSGSGKIIESGIYLSESTYPFIQNPKAKNELLGKKYTATALDRTSFSAYPADLKANKIYNYVAFTTTETGTYYGELKLLVTSYGTVSDVEGNLYQSVKIGRQIWMRENLKSKVYQDQTIINGSFDTVGDQSLGKHYTWKAANRIIPAIKSGTNKDVCPTGWHLPSDTEWRELLTYIGISADELNSIDLIGNDHAEKLKDAGSDHWTNGLINNSTGFSVLPAGICNNKENIGTIQTAFWTSTPNIFYGFQNESEKIMRGNSPAGLCGLSVRCIKD